MSETRVWLVYREYTDKGLLSLVYATPDGERVLHKERSLHAAEPTAATTVDDDTLEPVTDAERREQYQKEVGRMMERHDPEDVV
ncbi:hypothetical protein [Salarchaeum japonicum]|uniref:DUF7967 domain-containing protein n=1 Tax=Salarchaeum japonicum TaxID=555573 RepID=A0AAV3T0N7_9EURY|nr:hypothetical protein [Salarchaeum japonicum]